MGWIHVYCTASSQQDNLSGEWEIGPTGVEGWVGEVSEGFENLRFSFLREF